MKKASKIAALSPVGVQEVRKELARRIASFIGNKEILITDVPGLLLTRRTTPTPPVAANHEPSLAVVAQGASGQTSPEAFLSLMSRDTC